MKNTCFVVVLVMFCAVGLAVAGCDDVSSADASTTVAGETTTTVAATTTSAAATTTTTAPAQVTTTTTAPSGPAAKEHLLEGTYTWDVDGDGVDDLWNDVVDELVQYLQIQDGAQITRIAGKTFAAVTLADLQVAAYSSDPLSVEAVDYPDVIMEGEVIALQTSDGKYAKLEVDGFESFTGNDGIPYPRYSIRFQYVLYP